MSAKVSTLANGLRVVTHHMPGVETVSLGAWVNVGTRHERAEVNGIAHMLEHMAFKGTRRRSARAIAEEIESVGGHLNAYTSREFTAYHATVLGGDEGLALDIIADILQRSIFDETELERERAVILQEIGQAHDTPDDIIFDDFQETAFPDQPVGRPVLGRPELVAGMPRATLMAYMADNYRAGRMAVAAAGKVDHEAFAAAAAAAFATLGPADPAVAEPACYHGGEHREPRDLEQAHIVLGFQGVPYSDPDYYALSVVSTLLGGGMSSRLFQDIREERGLVYSIYTFGSSYTDTGLFGVYAGTGEAEGTEVVERMCGHLAGMADGLSEPELQRARAQLKAGIMMSLESTAARAEQIARQTLIFGRPLPPAEIAQKIDAVDREAVVRVGQRLKSSPPTVAAIGPIDGLPGYEAIRAALA